MPVGVHARALRKAAELVGSMEKLARRLQVPSADLIEWMNGKAEPPGWVFLQAVDLILDETPPAESELANPRYPEESSAVEGRSGTWL